MMCWRRVEAGTTILPPVFGESFGESDAILAL